MSDEDTNQHVPQENNHAVLKVESPEEIAMDTTENINIGSFGNESQEGIESPGQPENSPGFDNDLPHDDREPKLFVDVNVANFGLKRIIVYEGDTVESLAADFVKRCPIDELMTEKLKILLKQQMDGVLERIDEDED